MCFTHVQYVNMYTVFWSILSTHNSNWSLLARAAGGTCVCVLWELWLPRTRMGILCEKLCSRFRCMSIYIYIYIYIHVWKAKRDTSDTWNVILKITYWSSIYEMRKKTGIYYVRSSAAACAVYIYAYIQTYIHGAYIDSTCALLLTHEMWY